MLMSMRAESGVAEAAILVRWSGPREHKVESVKSCLLLIAGNSDIMDVLFRLVYCQLYCLSYHRRQLWSCMPPLKLLQSKAMLLTFVTVCSDTQGVCFAVISAW